MVSNHQCATPMFQPQWWMNQFTASPSIIGLLFHPHRSRTISRTGPANAICWKKTASRQRANQNERAVARSPTGHSTTSRNTRTNGVGEDEMSKDCWSGAANSTRWCGSGKKKKMMKNFGGRSGRQLIRKGSPTTSIKEVRNDQMGQSCSVFSIF